MEDEFERRYQDRLPGSVADLKEDLVIRIFGPYAGDCSYILSDVDDKLQHEGYNAKICLKAPESNSVSAMDEGEIYNLVASIDCMRQADVAVFVFLRAKEERFNEEEENSEDNVNENGNNTSIPQDLNSSVVVEFTKWVDHLDYTNERALVIYEDGIDEEIGSLIRGITREGSLPTRTVKASSREDLIRSIYRSIVGQSVTWTEELRDILEDRRNPIE